MLKIIRERDSYIEPYNAKGLCECGEEIELPLESWTYLPCKCGRWYDCNGQEELLLEEEYE